MSDKSHQFKRVARVEISSSAAPVCAKLPAYLESKVRGDGIRLNLSKLLRTAITVELIRRNLLSHIEICQAFNDEILSVQDVLSLIGYNLVSPGVVRNWLLCNIVDEDLVDDLRNCLDGFIPPPVSARHSTAVNRSRDARPQTSQRKSSRRARI